MKILKSVHLVLAIALATIGLFIMCCGRNMTVSGVQYGFSVFNIAVNMLLLWFSLIRRL